MAATTVHEEPQLEEPLSDETLEASTGFVGQWQQLVSTTNWEKGQIICQWRTALKNSGSPVTQYSDEAWAQMVGDVTGQHVGRLRRTYERFGEVASEYEGLYWSHFQTALDWQDAEMWLEGALQNKWSVAQMRAKRWETVGDGQPAPEETPEPADSEPNEQPESVLEAEEAEVRAPSESSDSADTEDDPESTVDDPSPAPAAERSTPVQPMKDLAELPEDLADAFEQFKLAILTHKMAGWQEVGRDDVLATLSALEQLALAPSGE